MIDPRDKVTRINGQTYAEFLDTLSFFQAHQVFEWTFAFDGHRVLFNVSAARWLCSDGRDPVAMGVPEVVEAMTPAQVEDVNSIYALSDECNLDAPIIAAQVVGGEYVIIDGRHRLYKAYVLHLDTLPCYLLTRAESELVTLPFTLPVSA